MLIEYKHISHGNVCTKCDNQSTPRDILLIRVLLRERGETKRRGTKERDSEGKGMRERGLVRRGTERMRVRVDMEMEGTEKRSGTERRETRVYIFSSSTT